MRAIVADSMANARFSMLMLAAFGGLGLVLAVTGIYAVLAHYVAQRRKSDYAWRWARLPAACCAWCSPTA